MKLHPLFTLVPAILLAACSMPSRSPAPMERAPAAYRTVERPGVGTTWGEQRDSWVEPTSFARQWGSHPAARDQLFYNDRDGNDATFSFLGGTPELANGLQPSASGLVRLGLRNAERRWLETWRLGARKFATGERGERYEVVLQNPTARRVEIVLSVDGLDALDGKSAAFAKRGYVLAPKETLAVEGFRTSDGTVAAFRFGAMGESYAQRKHSDAMNVGVIGVAVFQERWWASETLPRPENRAWRSAEPHHLPNSRPYATPPDA